MLRKSVRIHLCGTGTAPACSPLIFAVCLCLLSLSQPAHAEITWSGEVDPDDPTGWTSSTWCYVGKTGTGSLQVNADSDLNSYCSYIGYEPGSTGEVTVDGGGTTWNSSHYFYVGCEGNGTLSITSGAAVSNNYGYIGYYPSSTGDVTVDGSGSTWTNSGDLRVGYEGNGTLNVGGGAVVSVASDTYVAYEPASSGLINFGSGGGTLITGSFYASLTQLTGAGTINSRGLGSDVDLIFDSTHGLNQTITLNSQPNQNITVNLDMSGDYGSNGDLCAGYLGNGSLSILDGMSVNSKYGTIGYKLGSTGEVMIDGAGSTWINSEDLYVGRYGRGTLNITNAAAVNNSCNYVGYESGSIGEVTVNGSGSTWSSNRDLYIGYKGTGTLNISGGAVVSVVEDTYLAYLPSSSGSINFGTSSGTLVTGSLCASPTQLTGTGTINTRGLVSDIDLVFDSNHGLNQTITLKSRPDQNITVNLDMPYGSPSNGSLGAGYLDNGSLSILDGVAVHSKKGYIGFKSGSTGEVTVNGSGSMWGNSKLYVGHYGIGTLCISNGAEVKSEYSDIGYESGSFGEVMLDGTNSKWTISGGFRVGNYGNGILSIANGATVSDNNFNSFDHIYVGKEHGSTGVVYVDGANSSWAGESPLTIGYYGSGKLSITNGAAVSNFGSFIGCESESTGEVTVDGAGSTWTLRLLLTIGNHGSGTLSIINGAVVRSNTASHIFYNTAIGNESGSSGVVTVNGAGSTWSDSSTSLQIGNYGSGTLSITQGATVSNGSAYIGDKSGSIGEVTVSGAGSTWTTGGVLRCPHFLVQGL